MNPCTNGTTRVLITFLTDRSDGYCIADELRKNCDAESLTAEKIKRATILLLAEDKSIIKLAWVWRNLLLTSLIESVDWKTVSTVLATDPARN